MTSISSFLGTDVRSPWPRDIRHIALCGNPKCGKSTIAEMMVDEFGAVVMDDGLILRQALPILLGLPAEAPFTQEGKSQRYTLADREESVREGLGELGNYLEARYGDDIMPIRAMQMALASRGAAEVPFFVYPSVRKTQGRAYKRAGGLVIQVDNPLAPPSGNAFDVWDRSCVDFTIQNDPRDMNLDELREYVCALPELVTAAAS